MGNSNIYVSVIIAACRFVCFIFLLTIFSEANADSSSSGAKVSRALENIGSSGAGWNKFIAVLTKEALWIDRDAYDASHVLMIPMHYAFNASDNKGIADFELLMARFSKSELPGGQLNQAQWLYFVSRYLALRCQHGMPFSEVDTYLVQRVAAWLYGKWFLEPAYQWESLPFFGAKSRLAHIFSTDAKFNFNYYKAVTDYELFLFSIAADLSFILHRRPDISNLTSDEFKSAIRDVVGSGVRVIRSRGVFNQSKGWLFQVGLWADHIDYRYSGHAQVGSKLSENRISDIAEDASHSHRWPLFFRSLLNSPHLGVDDKYHVGEAYAGFCRQFKNSVVVRNGRGIFLNNFMDGRNGVYRYRYGTVGRNNKLGYGPFELSGILGESWYPFCTGVWNIFNAYKNSYPLRSDVLSIYIGPNSTRDRNLLFKWPDYFVKGFASLQAQHSAYISRDVEFQ